MKIVTLLQRNLEPATETLQNTDQLISPFRPSGHSKLNHPRGRVLVFARRNHQVIQVLVAPALAEILLQVFGALSIHGADAFFDVRALRQALA